MDRQAQMELILDHYENPRNQGHPDEFDVVMRGGNPGCGDVVTVYLRIDSDSETITDLGWNGMGCTISQAATSMISEEIVGERLDTVQAYDNDTLFALFGREVTASRLRCAALGLHTVKAAILRYRSGSEFTSANQSTTIDNEGESLGLEFESIED